MSYIDIIAIVIFIVFMSAKFVWDYYAPIASWVKLKWQRVKALWGEANFLKRTYIIAAGAVGVALLYLFARLYLEVLYIDWDNIGEDDGKIRNLAIAFVGTITGIGALFGFYLAILRSEENKRQNDTADQGLITDRISKATEGLGKIDNNGDPVVEVRLGALYALERISKDSLRDHVEIMEILCAYIRHNSLKHNADRLKNPPEDIHAAINIIGRRHKWENGVERLTKEIKQGYWLDLRNCNLQQILLDYVNLVKALLRNATLEQTVLIRADLSDAFLPYANLTDAVLNKTNFQNTYTKGAYAYKGDFSVCLNLTQEQINVMYCGIGVKIPNGLIRPRHWPTENLARENFTKAYFEWLKETGNLK